jgi:glycosyltransferase involved in cell wall biosynthesis
VSARLRAADVCALPFKYGATLKSGSLLAALAHGVPTVATRGELPAPTLVHGEHIWLVPPRQPEALAAALGGVLSDPTLQVRLRTGALALAATHNWAAIAQQHLALYDELVPTR